VRLRGEVLVPLQRLRAVLRAQGVVRLEVRVDVALARGARAQPRRRLRLSGSGLRGEGGEEEGGYREELHVVVVGKR
jgi:hypothetical protein